MGIGLSFALNGLFYFYKMAKNKKSFILYCDIIHTVDKLPDEVAGKLFKTILNYVNDKNPEPEELILQIAFEPIKHQLKRDLKDWEVKRKKRSDAGRVGMENRWHNDKKTITNDNNTITNDNNVKNVITKITDNVTVTVNDNVNVINNKKEPFDFSIFNQYELTIIQDWINYRKEIKAPLTDRSIKQLRKTIDKAGGVPEFRELVEKSIQNGWRGLFPDKEPKFKAKY